MRKTTIMMIITKPKIILLLSYIIACNLCLVYLLSKNLLN